VYKIAASVAQLTKGIFVSCLFTYSCGSHLREHKKILCIAYISN